MENGFAAKCSVWAGGACRRAGFSPYYRLFLAAKDGYGDRKPSPPWNAAMLLSRIRARF